MHCSKVVTILVPIYIYIWDILVCYVTVQY